MQPFKSSRLSCNTKLIVRMTTVTNSSRTKAYLPRSIKYNRATRECADEVFPMWLAGLALAICRDEYTPIFRAEDVLQ